MPNKLSPDFEHYKATRQAAAATTKALDPRTESTTGPSPATAGSAFDKISAGGFIRQDQLIGKRSVSAEEVAINRKRHAEAAKNLKRVSCPVREREGVAGVVPFSSATLWRKVRAGTFPAPCKLSERITAWRVGDVRQWLEAQAQA